jgi:outer membrane protein assembly factor BamA
VVIVGNRWTRDHIVKRELEFSKGDTLALRDLPEILRRSEENLVRTKLFYDVGINWKREEEDGSVKQVFVVELKEAWYIYPGLIFELADRNFNVWWNEMNADLSRVNFGGRLDHLNLTGRRDKLNLKYHDGYTRKMELAYYYPFINRKGTWGASFNALYANQKEVGYITRENILRFVNRDRHIYNRFRLSSAWIYRPKFRHTHTAKVEFYNNDIDPEILESYNPLFYRQGQQSLRFFVLEYQWNYNDLNHFNYPTSGIQARVTARKEGVGIFSDVNLMHITFSMERYDQYGKTGRWSSGVQLKARKLITRGNPGYYHYTALGYGQDQLRGYEFYVIDGTDYVYTKGHLNFLVKEWNKTLGSWVIFPQFKDFSLKAYVAMSADLGYVNSPYFNGENELNNSYLIGGGPALHVLLYNYFLLRVEYSVNRQGENALFLHFNANF